MKFACGAILAISILANSAALADTAVPPTQAIEPSSEQIQETEGDREGGGKKWAVTGGCVGGAVLGSVLPGLGNLIGCTVGGVIAWALY